MLSRKHYGRLAKIMAKEQTGQDVFWDLMVFFKWDNPRFDEAKFLEAIMKESQK